MVFQTSNMSTQHFIKEIHHALMENHYLSLVKKKVDIHLLKLMTKNPRIQEGSILKFAYSLISFKKIKIL
jgi:hypothetical protein